MRFSFLFVVLAASFTAAAPSKPAPRGPTPIPNSHIILLKPEAKADTFNSWVSSRISGKNTRTVLDTWDVSPTFRGLVGTFDDDFIKGCKDRDDIAGIYPNMIHRISGQQSQAPSWGLPRVSSRTPGSTTYNYPDNGGAGVTAYIIDTGVRISHKDFGGRATFLYSADGKKEDDNGHGTHCAGTVGGATYGIAKNVTIAAVRVCNDKGECTSADIIKGVNAAIADAKGKKAIANMSLGGGIDPTIDAAVQAGIDSGITFALAAGNESGDSCNASPSRVPGAITVGATDKTDNQAAFSNFGTCLDLFAPGVDIVSAFNRNDDDQETASGTSMASPHAAGVLALLASTGNFNPPELCDKLVALATKDVVKGITAGSPNLLLFNGAGSS